MFVIRGNDGSVWLHDPFTQKSAVMWDTPGVSMTVYDPWGMFKEYGGTRRGYVDFDADAQKKYTSKAA